MAPRFERFANLPVRTSEGCRCAVAKSSARLVGLGLLASVQSRQRVSSGREVWPKPQRLLVVLDCLRHSTRFLEGDPEIFVGLGVIGFDPQGLLELGDGFLDPARACQSDPQIVAGLGVIGIDP